MAEIITSIDGKGNVTTRVEGVKGSRCYELTRGLNEKLGVTVATDATDEYYEAPDEERAEDSR
jgi:hypothetical protein